MDTKSKGSVLRIAGWVDAVCGLSWPLRVDANGRFDRMVLILRITIRRLIGCLSGAYRVQK